MKVAISTLGCKVNQYETQAMEQELRRRGHEIVDFSDAADAYVVNSCSVTAVSDRKSRQQLYRIRREHPAAVAALCGCYVQTHLDEVRKLDVDLLAGTGGRMEFLDRLDNDIAPAKRLGMRTVRILQGYGALSRPRNGWEEPEETVRTLAELPGLFSEDKGETE